jgi:hypothetical protein
MTGAPFDLFAVLHGNLGFSSIPVEDYPVVLDRCFWPVVEELSGDSGLRLGLEFPGASLQWVARHDGSFIDALRRLLDDGRAELVGSGLTQAIQPLVPAYVGLRNLQLGNRVYEDVLGVRPRVAYANEQTSSDGAARLYEEAGYEAIVIDWENASQNGRLSPDARWAAPRLADGQLRVLWASTVMFQRLQRVAYGQLTPPELLADLEELQGAERRPLCLYSNDWEVFDYYPGRPPRAALLPPASPDQLPRFLGVLRAVREAGLGDYLLPGEVLDRYRSDEPVTVSSAEAPILTKKQPKYNPARWALCGTTASYVNTACARLEREVVRARNAATDNDLAAVDDLDEQLVLLHASDLRTSLTQPKADAMYADVGRLTTDAARLARDQQSRTEPADVVLANATGGRWRGWPVAVDLRLPPGRWATSVELVEAGSGDRPLQQVETVERFPDGSLRRARVVLGGIELGPGEGAGFTVREAAPADVGMSGSAEPAVTTATVQATFLPRRGGSLARVTFAGRTAVALGHVPYGRFSPIHLTPDWYTGNVVLVDESGTQRTDLTGTTVHVPDNADAWPVRVPVVSEVHADGMSVVRTTWVSRREPRVDLDIALTLPNIAPRSLHAGILTLDPRSLGPDDVRFATVNGGTDPGEHVLGAEAVRQTASPSHRVSVSSCLGSTEGWAAVFGSEGGVALHVDRTLTAGNPLLEYEATPEGPFVRLVPSFAETADTGSPRFRGRLHVGVAYEAFDELSADLVDDWSIRRIGLRVGGILTASDG